MDEDGRLKSKVVLRDEEPASHVKFSMLGQIGPALVIVVASLIAVYVAPGLEFARPWTSGEPVPFWNVAGRPFEQAELEATQERATEIETVARDVEADEPAPVVDPDREKPTLEAGAALPAYRPREDDDKPVVQPLEFADAGQIDRFFAALGRSDHGIKGAVTRVVHWGDSAIGLDGITGSIRRRMQNRFGDAGHGFHLIAPPNKSYLHREVQFRHNGKWDHCFIIFKCKRDGRYGLGGTTFFASGGARSTFAPSAKHSSGAVSKFELWYAAQPHGGRLSLRVDAQEPKYLDTNAEKTEDRWHAIEVEDGRHKFEVRATGGARVRLYGVTMERDGPGVVWDGLAWVGSFTNRPLAYDEDHLRSQLAHRDPALIVLSFGGNDMIRKKMTMAQYAQEYRDVVKLLRRVRPESDCLITAPLDHGKRKGARVVSLPIVPRMVAAQREVAKSEGCAFFDTFAAMGGDGSAARWFRRDPKLLGGDLSHATKHGQQVIGELAFRAIVQAYVAYRKRTDPQ